MSRQRLILGLVLVVGCGQPAPPKPVLRRGDIVRPQIALAAPWSVGARPSIGMLLEIHRRGQRKVTFLDDKDVKPEEATMQAKVTFFNGDAPLGEPLEVPFVRDC